MKYSEYKNSMYAVAGVCKTRLKEDSEGLYLRPGFFTPYQSFSDFSHQLKAPIVMPILCVVTALREVVELLENGVLTGVNIAVFDFHQAWDHVKQGATNTGFALYFVLSTVVDALWSLVSFLARTVASAISLAGMGIKASIDCCTSDVGPVYQPLAVTDSYSTY